MLVYKQSVFIAVFLSVVFQGCATMTWQSASRPQSALSPDRFQCENNSARLYPQVFVAEQVADGYRTPKQTDCRKYGNEVQCTTYGGDYIPPVVATVDVNKNNRDSSFADCMRAFGWELKPAREAK